MMYDISIKNFNNVEVFRGQNLTEELTKQVLDKYTHLPIVNVWQSPEPEEQNKAKKYAKFLKNYCEKKSCAFCDLYDTDESICTVKEDYPCDWKLKAGDNK